MSQCQLWLLNNKVDKSGNNKKSQKLNKKLYIYSS